MYPNALNVTSKKSTNTLVRVIFQPYCQRLVLQNLAVTEWERDGGGGGFRNGLTENKRGPVSLRHLCVMNEVGSKNYPLAVTRYAPALTPYHPPNIWFTVQKRKGSVTIFTAAATRCYLKEIVNQKSIYWRSSAKYFIYFRKRGYYRCFK